MIKIDYDAEHNVVAVVFEGDVDAAQARRAYLDLDAALSKSREGLKVLADFSSVETMEPEVEGEVLKAMDLVNARGVSEVLHVLPDPDLDLGFNIMSSAHYSKQVRLRTVRSREEAQALLQAGVK